LFYIHSIKPSQDASEMFLLNRTDAPSQAHVDVDPVEATNLLESTYVDNVPVGTKHDYDAKRHRSSTSSMAQPSHFHAHQGSSRSGTSYSKEPSLPAPQAAISVGTLNNSGGGIISGFNVENNYG
jgi:hypothetical protein